MAEGVRRTEDTFRPCSADQTHLSLPQVQGTIRLDLVFQDSAPKPASEHTQMGLRTKLDEKSAVVDLLCWIDGWTRFL